MRDDLENARATEKSRRAIARVSEALGVPISSLYEPIAVLEEMAPSRLVDPAEIHSLVQAYLRISDPEARRRCIAIIRASAHPEPDSPEPNLPSRGATAF